jgi:ribosome-associated toxin RatA of RatAB toxin-antitoxin module
MSRIPLAVTLPLLLSLVGSLQAGISPSWNSSTKAKISNGGVALFPPGKHPASGARLAAAIHVEATREEVWAVISNPAKQPEFLSNVKRARVTQLSPVSQLVDHEVKPSFLPMTLSYRYRTQQVPLQRIDFARVSGQVRGFEGRWVLHDAPGLIGKPGTVIFYELFIDPGNGLPQNLVRQNLHKDMPSMLGKVRQRVYTVRGRS